MYAIRSYYAQQHLDLERAVLELIDEYAAGTKRPKVYFQFKMYNDPALNFIDGFLYRFIAGGFGNYIEAIEYRHPTGNHGSQSSGKFVV